MRVASSFATAARQVALMGLVALCAVTDAEIVILSLRLQPGSSNLHFYSEGSIRAPGVIDLSDLSFTAVSSNMDHSGTLNDNIVEDFDLGGDSTDGTEIDIVVFPLPEVCATARGGCDFTDLGVGARTRWRPLRWCCSNDAIDWSLCSRESYGRLIINQTMFSGHARHVNIPQLGDVHKQIDNGTLDQHVSGYYSIVMVNCNEAGRMVLVSGNLIWKSKDGYLPGDLFGVIRFYIFLTVLYLVVLSWHGTNMLKDEGSRVSIQKWIFATILFGLLETLFNCDLLHRMEP
jgi:hypothetical protein